MIERMAEIAPVSIRSDVDDIDGVFEAGRDITVYHVKSLNNVTARDSRPRRRPGGFGLKGIAERMDMLGGTHTIDSSPGRGTTVTVRIRRPT